ncbi:MAG: hypothetical protein Q9213_002098 [Squamulea squamosa]
MAGPTPAQIQYQLQHIQDDRSNEIIVAFAICLGFAIITVLLRFGARHLTKAPLGGDDWTIVFGLAIAASIVLYIVSLAATKVSILLLYRRIFPNREFHAIIWGVGLFVVAFTIANVLSIIFSCRPINGAWNPLIKAKRINTEAAILAVACLTTATDFIILALPLPLVWKLHLPTVRKFQITLVFLLGTFNLHSASVISIYRATVVAKVDQADISYQSTSRSIWSGVEICIAIVCANLATLRPLLNYIFTGKAPWTAGSGPTSGVTVSGTGTKSRLRWTWRHVAEPHQATKVSKDGTFHRLEQHPAEQSTDDIERQKFEEHMMSTISSPKMPETVHF